MASLPSDPEKYSIDEMLERLKAKAPEAPPEQGQLVIRDDGTAAIRVRKRKRRSTQPKKEEARRNRRAMVIQISAVLVLLILAGLAVGGGIVFANSVIFRNGLVEKIGNATGGSVDLRLFRMNPSHAHADALVIEWPEGHVLRKLSLGNLKAEIYPSSFLGKSFVGDEVTARAGILALGVAGEGAPAAVAEMDAREPKGGAHIAFNRYGVGDLEIILGDPADPAGRLTGTEASFYTTTVSGYPQLRLTRGDLAFDGWPALRVERGLFEFRGRDMEIVSLKLAAGTDLRGTLDLAGTVHLLDPGKPSTLRLTASSFPLAGIAGGEIGSFITGRVDTEPDSTTDLLTFSAGPGSAGTMSLSFRSSLDSSIELNRFPFLFDLAEALQDDWFEQPIFPADATGTVRRAAGVVRLGNLSFMSKGRMALRGDIAMDRGGLLSGVLEVGLAVPMIESAASRRLDTLFGPPSRGFRWMEVTIGGTADAPDDNFREQYESSGRPASGEVPSPRSTFEELTRPR